MNLWAGKVGALGLAYMGSSAHLSLGPEDRDQQPHEKPYAGSKGFGSAPRRRELLFLADQTVIVHHNEMRVPGQSPWGPHEEELGNFCFGQG